MESKQQENTIFHRKLSNEESHEYSQKFFEKFYETQFYETPSDHKLTDLLRNPQPPAPPDHKLTKSAPCHMVVVTTGPGTRIQGTGTLRKKAKAIAGEDTEAKMITAKRKTDTTEQEGPAGKRPMIQATEDKPTTSSSSSTAPHPPGSPLPLPPGSPLPCPQTGHRGK